MKIKAISTGGYSYRCPCGDMHYVTSSWQFSGDHEKPTFSPSVLVRSGHYAKAATPTDCWCDYNAKHPGDELTFTCYVCHSFIRDGMVQFLSDCTHRLAGQTVELPDLGG